MIGIPPPPGMTREFIASWYWDEVRLGDEWHTLGHCDCGSDPRFFCLHLDNLIVGAIDNEVIGHLVPVAGFTQPQPLSSLLAPYRTREGGLAEREEAARRSTLDRPVPRRYRSGDSA